MATTGHIEECPDIGPACSSATPPAAYRHHVRLLFNETALDAAYGVNASFAAEARLAFRVVDVTPSFFELDGTPRAAGDFHHKNETLTGPSDAWLLGRFSAVSGRFTTAARLGITLPLGNTVPDPYRLGAEGRPHEHIQFGTGTFVPIVGGAVSYAAPTFEVSASALAFFSLYENSEGFRAPNRLFVSTRVTIPLAEGTWRPYGVVEFAHESRERWNGTPGLESYVRADVLAGAGLSWQFAAPWQVELGLRIRAAQLASTVSFDYPGILLFGLSTQFDVVKSTKAPKPGSK